MITKFGKRFLTDFIAGNSAFNSKDIALGIGTNAAVENDTRLESVSYTHLTLPTKA